MTLDEFFIHLENSNRAWTLDAQKHIRTVKSELCPLAAVATDQGYEVRKESIMDSCTYLELSLDDGSTIATAADNFNWCMEIRQRLLEACNLIVPEITERKKTDAKLQVS